MLEEARAAESRSLPAGSSAGNLLLQSGGAALPENLNLPHLLQLSANLLGKKLSELRVAQKVKEAKAAEARKAQQAQEAKDAAEGKLVKKGKKGKKGKGAKEVVKEVQEVSWQEGGEALRFLKIVAKMDAATEELFLRQHGFVKELVGKLVGWGKHFDAARLLSGEGEVRDHSPLLPWTYASVFVLRRCPD